MDFKYITRIIYIKTEIHADTELTSSDEQSKCVSTHIPLKILNVPILNVNHCSNVSVRSWKQRAVVFSKDCHTTNRDHYTWPDEC